MLRKSYVDAFLDGYKPAIQIETFHSRFEDVSSSSHPRVPYMDSEELMMFFQSEKEKMNYLERIEGVNRFSYEANIVLGLTLGFPKKSVEYFSEMQEAMQQSDELFANMKRYELGIEWAGFYFSTHFDLVEEETKWLWSTYTHPKAIEEPFYLWSQETSYIEVAFGDFDQLKEVRGYIMKKRGLVPAVKG